MIMVSLKVNPTFKVLNCPCTFCDQFLCQWNHCRLTPIKLFPIVRPTEYPTNWVICTLKIYSLHQECCLLSTKVPRTTQTFKTILHIKWQLHQEGFLPPTSFLLYIRKVGFCACLTRMIHFCVITIHSSKKLEGKKVYTWSLYFIMHSGN